MRHVILGDIHGCYRELQGLLQKVRYTPQEDHLYSVGDLINKGPYSLEVLLWAMDHPNLTVVQGNHERSFLKYLKQEDEGLGREHPYFYPLSKGLGARREAAINYLKSLPLFYDGPEFLLVHAGLAPGTPLEGQSPRILTTIRTWDGLGEDLADLSNPPWFDLYQGHKLVIFGHWASRGLVFEDRVVGLDTGCVYGGALSALVLPGRKVFSYQAHREYQKVSS